MKNILNWPEPPININDEPNNVNLNANNVNLNPNNEDNTEIILHDVPYSFNNISLTLKEHSQPVDYEKILHLTNKSYAHFKNLLVNFSTNNNLDKIVKIHTKINEILNRGKYHEQSDTVQKAKDIQVEYAKGIIEKIKTNKDI